jgi:Tat protein secretion system quality control protein TatD with DNase activity
MICGEDVDDTVECTHEHVSEFPWHLGVYDAHCHPTDIVPSLAQLPTMKTSVLTIMATRSQDQDLVFNAAKSYPFDISSVTKVDQSSGPCQVLPSFGWHPWFSHHLYDDLSSEGPLTPEAHYAKVLTPPAPPALAKSLPPPQPLSAYFSSLRQNLLAHPHALVGEIGLDKSFRVPDPSSPSQTTTKELDLTPGGREGRALTPCRVVMAHQQAILKIQLRLAGELGRAVSVHGVAAHGVLFQALRQTWQGYEKELVGKRKRKGQKDVPQIEESRNEDKENARTGRGEISGKPYPSRICLHSYSGSAEGLTQYFHPSVPATIFVSFSHVINFDTSSGSIERAIQCIKAVPDDRILVESDLHIAGERMDGYLEEITRKVCNYKNWQLHDGVRRLGRNWRHFALGIIDEAND